jgi:hypothetical protein
MDSQEKYCEELKKEIKKQGMLIVDDEKGTIKLDDGGKNE